MPNDIVIDFEEAEKYPPFTAPLRKLIDNGGEGSGNYGHKGRPGLVGGSQPTNSFVGLIPINGDPEFTTHQAVQYVKDLFASMNDEALINSRISKITVFENPEDASAYINNNIKEVPDGEMARGCFNRYTGEMVISLYHHDDSIDYPNKDNWSARVFYHEFAHSRDDLITSTEWEGIWTKHSFFTDQDEDFAQRYDDYKMVTTHGGKYNQSDLEKDLANMFESFGL